MFKNNKLQNHTNIFRIIFNVILIILCIAIINYSYDTYLTNLKNPISDAQKLTIIFIVLLSIFVLWTLYKIIVNIISFVQNIKLKKEQLLTLRRTDDYILFVNSKKVVGIKLLIFSFVFILLSLIFWGVLIFSSTTPIWINLIYLFLWILLLNSFIRNIILYNSKRNLNNPKKIAELKKCYLLTSFKFVSFIKSIYENS